MEVARENRSGRKAVEADQRDAILRRWRELGEPAIDARALNEIRRQILTEFHGKVTSPAAIARIIADAGGELRHPDVIEVDAQWRQSELEQAREIAGIEALTSGEVLTLAEAERTLFRLEELRQQYESIGDEELFVPLRTLAIQARREAELLSRNTTADTIRREQTEIAEWLKVWLQTPSLFADWLELRKRSVEFRQGFGVNES